MRYLIVLLLVGCATAGPSLDGDIDAAIENEAKAYAAMLTSKVDRGEMSYEEAKYLYTRKVNELVDRATAQDSARAAARQSPSSQTTHCRRDWFSGDVRCVTR